MRGSYNTVLQHFPTDHSMRIADGGGYQRGRVFGEGNGDADEVGTVVESCCVE